MKSKSQNLLFYILSIFFVGSFFIYPPWGRFVFTHFYYVIGFLCIFFAYAILSLMWKRSNYLSIPFLCSLFRAISNDSKFWNIIRIAIINSFIAFFIVIFVTSPITFLIVSITSDNFIINTICAMIVAVCLFGMQICAGYWTFKPFKLRAWIIGLKVSTIYTIGFAGLMFFLALEKSGNKPSEIIKEFIQDPLGFYKFFTIIGLFFGVGIFVGSIFASLKTSRVS